MPVELESRVERLVNPILVACRRETTHRRATWILRISLLVVGGAIGYAAIALTPLFFNSPSASSMFRFSGAWLSVLAVASFASLLAAICLTLSGETGIPVSVGIRTLATAILLGAAAHVALAVPGMLNPMQPDPLARLSARLYVPAVRISEWRNASVSRSPTIEVQGTPDADALYLQYAFSAEDRKGRDLEVAWGLHYPEGAEVSTFCSNADENTGTKGETTFSADVSQPEEEHLYYCPGSADVTVVLRGKVKDQVWADVNQVTKSIAFEAPTDFVAATAMGITLVSIPAPGPDNQNVAAVLGESTPKWPPRVTFTSSVDYWDSNWRWDSVTSGVGIPFQKGFVFPRALQEDAEASSLTSSETQKMVFSATMVNPVETQRLQAYRDFALLILGGAFTFTAIYWRPDAPPLAKDAGAGGSQATPRERPATTPDEEITRIGASEDEEPPRSSIGSNDPESRSEASAKGEGEEETGATSKRVEGSE